MRRSKVRSCGYRALLRGAGVGCLALLAGFAGGGGARQGFAAEPPDAIKKILEAARNAQRPGQIAFDTECTTAWEAFSAAGERGQISLETSTSHFRRKGPLYDLQIEQLYNGTGWKSRQVWDGKRAYLRKPLHEDETKDTNWFFRHDGKAVALTEYSERIAGYLDGKFDWLYEVGDWTKLVESSSAPTLSTETLGGHACDVIEADTPYGIYKFWVDPAAGYGLRASHGLIRGSDTYAEGRQFAEAKPGAAEMEFQVEGVAIEGIGGVHLPVSGEIKRTIRMRDGTAQTSKLTGKRLNLDLNPDFASLGAFVVDVPEGTLFLNTELMIPCEWRNGEPVIQLDKRTRELAEEAASKFGQAPEASPMIAALRGSGSDATNATPARGLAARSVLIGALAACAIGGLILAGFRRRVARVRGGA